MPVRTSGKRQIDLLQTAWEESGKVYGYRKLHDDLLDHGETCCPNRVARLTRIAGIKAQIATSAVLEFTAAGLPLSSTTLWTVNSTLLLRTRRGSPTELARFV